MVLFGDGQEGRIGMSSEGRGCSNGLASRRLSTLRSFATGVVSILLLGLLGGCFTTAGASGRADESAPCVAPEDPERMADQVLHLVNLERAEADIPPVTPNPALEKIADDYACRMIAEDFFGHTDPLTGHGPGDRAVVGKYSFYAIGENLAAGQETAAEVMKVWMDSPSHRNIILDEKWSEVGIAVRIGGDYSIYWVQEFGDPADY